MSYCVNCGVELHSSLESCPLCNTPVINPKELQKAKNPSPYAREKGQVDVVKRRDMAILIITVLVATSLSCLLLNIFVFTGRPWCLYIIGLCLMLFVLAIPTLTHTRFPIYIYLLLDGFTVGFFLYMISFNTSDNRWFYKLALPIVVLTTILVEILALLLKHLPVSFLTTALYVFIEIALLCVGLELLIDHYLGVPLHLVWSAIVLTVCGVISAMLITILSIRRLRDAVRRRLHF